MRVLWSANTMPPAVAEKIGIHSMHSISWVTAMASEISKIRDIRLAIAVPGNVKALKSCIFEEIDYYIMPIDSDEMIWNSIIQEFKPDVIHAYGTEMQHNLSLIEHYVDKLPIIISLQGILTEYQKYYYAGIPLKDILKNITISDILLKRSIFDGKKRFIKQSAIERRMLKKVLYVEGRSSWDNAISWGINPNLQYFHCPRMIRSSFYEHKWNSNSIDKHSIFVTQGDYPIKGIHFVLEALSIVKEFYPDVKLYIAGKNIVERKTVKQKLTTPGYIKYIGKIIKDLNIAENIVFTGYLDEKQMSNLMCETSLYINSSSIENAPNSLAEAMILGMPCIASFAGGNSEMLNDGECGYIYRYNEPEVLAKLIISVFEDKETAQNKAQLARTIAMKRHNPELLVDKIVGIYKEVISDFQNRNDKV